MTDLPHPAPTDLQTLAESGDLPNEDGFEYREARPLDADVLGSRLGLSPEAIEEMKARVAAIQASVTPESLAAFRDRKFAGALSFVHTAQRDETRRRELIAYPQSLFRGEGLWLWGTDETTLVHRILVGNQTCFQVAPGPIPGLYFEAGLAFDDFEALLERESPPDDWRCEALKSTPKVPKHQRIRMLTAEVGNTVLLDAEGPITHAVMWGTTVH